MTQASATIQFDEFDTRDLEDISQKWLKWITKLTRYFTFKELDDTDAKTNELFLFGGYDLEQVYKQVEEQHDDYDDVIRKLTAHFNTAHSAHLNRFKFRNIEQMEEETFDEFVSKVRIAAKTCNFTNEEEEITSHIIQRCSSDGLKSKALRSNNQLTLKQIIDMGRLDESVKHHIEQMSRKNVNTTSQDMNKCRNCGYDKLHQRTAGICPARGRNCKNCGKDNHYARMCRSKKANTIQKTSSSNESSDDDSNSTGSEYWASTAAKSVKAVKKYVNSLFMPTVMLILCQVFMSFALDTNNVKFATISINRMKKSRVFFPPPPRAWPFFIG